LKNDRILLTHGSGGRLTHELIGNLFKKYFSNPVLNALDDSAELAVRSSGSARLAFTTDSFVVNPIFFPGGDIGKLAVCGTVNDLAMKGAKPLWISVAAIIEEGFEISALEKIVISIAKTAREAGVLVVTGDTKVVEKGKADKLFLTTSGIGVINKGVNISGKNAKPGNMVLINGSIGDHGTAVLTARNDFKLTLNIKSDCAPLYALSAKIVSACKGVNVLRDPTRGGIATTLNEIASASNVGIIIEERSIPIKKEVKAVCELLGLDPLYVANEGKLLAIVPGNSSKKLLGVMKNDKLGRESSIIGRVVKSPKGLWLETNSGALRPLIMLEGEQLPRIC
jgi:hydrogenase expression/formation protein HypE